MDPMHSDPPPRRDDSPPRSRSARNSPTAIEHRRRMLRLWLVLTEMYGHRWTSAMGTEPTETWVEACAELTDVEWRRALVTLKHTVAEWPPTLPTFRRWAYGLPSVARAKSDAAQAFDRNPLIDGTSAWDADRESYEQRERRKRAYVAAAASQAERDQRPAAVPALGHQPAGIEHA